jgi:hypothetical protein
MTKTNTWQTRPLVREGAPKRQNSNFEGGKKFWSNVPGSGSTPRHTDWLTVAMWLWFWLWLLQNQKIWFTWLITLCYVQWHEHSSSSAVGIAAGCGPDNSGIWIRVPIGPIICIPPHHPDRLWGLSRSPIRWVAGTLSPGVKREEREADH